MFSRLFSALWVAFFYFLQPAGYKQAPPHLTVYHQLFLRCQDNKAVVRTDFFPGLGWMLPRRVWNEVAEDWPQAYWDDWIREPLRRQGRQFLRPEVCRTYHFGKKVG